jgi:hypothetical protein
MKFFDIKMTMLAYTQTHIHNAIFNELKETILFCLFLRWIILNMNNFISGRNFKFILFTLWIFILGINQNFQLKEGNIIKIHIQLLMKLKRSMFEKSLFHNSRQICLLNPKKIPVQFKEISKSIFLSAISFLFLWFWYASHISVKFWIIVFNHLSQISLILSNVRNS